MNVWGNGMYVWDMRGYYKPTPPTAKKRYPTKAMIKAQRSKRKVKR